MDWGGKDMAKRENWGKGMGKEGVEKGGEG